MINQNLSGVFNGNAAGVEQEEYEDPSMAYEEQMRRVAHNGELRALQPINFEDKIMGGRNASQFMQEKFPELMGMGFNQRVNQITGKGNGTMEEQFDTEQKVNNVLSSQDDPVNKVNAMLGGMGASSSDKMNMLLGGGSSSKKDIGAYLGTGKPSKQKSVSSYLDSFSGSNKKPKSSMDVVSSMLFERDKKKKEVKEFNFDMGSGFGKRAFAGLNLSGNTPDINKMLNNNPQRKTHTKKILDTGLQNPFGKHKNMDSNIKSMFGTFGNPERTAKKRMAQQKGLPMFGDFDKDGLMNVVDCDPLDYMKQGEQHNLQNYMGDGNVQPDSVSVSPESTNKQPMGNFKLNTATAVDYDNDGDVDKKDVASLSQLSARELLDFAEDGLKTAKGTNERKRYLDIIKNVSKAVPGGDDFYKLQKEEMKIGFDRYKFDTEREQKQKQDMLQLQSNKSKSERALQLEENRFEYGKERDQVGDSLRFMKLADDATQKEFTRMRQEKLDEAKLRNEERGFKLEAAKFRSQEQKNDLALWESKLRAGSNMLGGLIGGGEGPSDMSKAVGPIGGNNINNPIAVTGGGSNPYAMAESIGEFSMGRSFGSKVGESVGMPTQSKSFASKVNDSIGNRKPQEVIEEEKQQGMMQYAPQQNIQPVAPQPISPSQMGSSQEMQQQEEYEIPPVAPQRIQQPEMRPQYGRPGTLPVERPPANIDWDRVSPDQVAPIDPQYAKYLAESKGETTYRRGPYRKG